MRALINRSVCMSLCCLKHIFLGCRPSKDVILRWSVDRTIFLCEIFGGIFIFVIVPFSVSAVVIDERKSRYEMCEPARSWRMRNALDRVTYKTIEENH